MSIGLRMAGIAQPRPIDPALVGWWKMDGNLTDSSGNGNNGTVGAGSAAYAAGKFGQAWDSDATRYVDCGNDASLRSTSALTVSAWVRRTGSSSGFMGIAARWVSDANNRVWWLGTSNNNFGFYLSDSGSTVSAFNLQTTTPAPLNEWAHIVGVYTGITHALYLNGVLLQASPSTPSALHSNSINLQIGAFTGGQLKFLGQIDNTMIYNRALDPAEIRYVYQSGRPVLL